MILPIYLLLTILLTRAECLVQTLPFKMFFGMKFIACPLNTCAGKCSQINATGTEESVIFTCKCDDYCVLFGDCCYSYYTLCHIFMTTNSLITFMKNRGRLNIEDQRTRNLIYFSERSRCLKIKFESIPHTTQGILMIGQCDLENVDGDIRDKCEGKKSAFPNDIPVSLENEPFITFKNPYCAACNSLAFEKHLVHWRANIQCHVAGPTIIRTYTDLRENEKRCSTLLTKPKNSKVRKCELQFEETVCVEDDGSAGNMTSDYPENEDEITKVISSAGRNVEEELTDLDATETVTTEEYVSLPPPSFTEAVFTEIKASYNTGDLMEEDVYKMIRDNQAILCRSYVFPESATGGKTYKNPHCYGCVLGWNAFRNSSEYRDGFFCSFVPGNNASPYFPNSRNVDHYYAFYKGRAVFFSSELGYVLEPLPNICKSNNFFHPLTERCESKLCPFGSSPHYGACINNDFQLRQLPVRTPSKYLYLTMTATWRGQGTDFEDITSNMINEIKSLSFNQLQLTDSSPMSMEKMSRGSKVSSLTILQQFIGSPTITGWTVAKVELTIPLMFGRLDDLFADLSYKLRDTNKLAIHNIYVKNYENPKMVSCPNTKLITNFNLTTSSFDNYVFANTETGFAYIQHTWFTWYSDRENRPMIIKMNFCDEPLIHPIEANTQPDSMTTERTTLESTEENHIENCLNWTRLTNDKFDVVKGGILLKSGQMLKDSQFESIEEGAIRVCSNNILLFGVTKLDTSSKDKFKDISSGLALGFKLLSFLISVLRNGIHSGAVYFHLLALSSSLIDVVHLLENSELVSSYQLLPILLHFSWLFAIYSSLAWCLIITFIVRKASKCVFRHLSVALIVPVATIVICASGDINDPPWNVGYGASKHLFSVGRDAFIYGYILPICIGFTANIATFTIKLVRRHDKRSNDIFFIYSFVIMTLMAIQFSLASVGRLVDNVSIHYFYFTLSLIISWTFMITNISPASSHNVSSRYLPSVGSTITDKD